MLQPGLRRGQDLPQQLCGDGGLSAVLGEGVARLTHVGGLLGHRFDAFVGLQRARTMSG